MRKLASIQTIGTVESIPNADAIERVRVLGWSVVVKKGEFRTGDKVVYCEIDSFLPERSEFEFLRSNSFKPSIEEHGVQIRRSGFRIKTIRLRGQVSQGICFPLSLLPPGTDLSDGANVTDLLQIVKYEVPPPLGLVSTPGQPFPGFLPKTDEIRVQVLQPVLERHRGRTFVMTEKLDGSSFTAFFRQGEFGVCSRNTWLDPDDRKSTLMKLAERLRLEEQLSKISNEIGFDIAIQGEIIGPGIQSNRYGIQKHELHIFNVLNLQTGGLLAHGEILQIANTLQLPSVPVLGEIELNHTIDELVEMSAGFSVLNPKVLREGIVFRPLIEEFDPDIGGRLSFKVINPQFLIKYDE